MSEKYIETHIRNYVNGRPKSFVIKLHADGTQGKDTLDLLGALDGVPFFVEVKDVDGAPSLMQQALVKRYADCGYVTGIVKSVDEFKALFGKGVGWYLYKRLLPSGWHLHITDTPHTVPDEFRFMESFLTYEDAIEARDAFADKYNRRENYE